MKVGLIDADMYWRKKSHSRWGKQKSKIFPNLALMKLSAWHKSQGDDVSWYMGMEWYDRVYISKVFGDTIENLEAIQADEVYRGGSGYCIHLENGKEVWREPYVMVYDKINAAPFYKSLQRWVNNRAIFHTIDKFEDYNKKLAKE